MAAQILHILFTIFALYGVFRLWRAIGASSRTILWLTAAGVLLRAVGGQAAFWISFLKLPVARSLQLSNGLWIFANDAVGYYAKAAAAADAGPLAIIFMNRTESSVFYAQTLATGMWLFGLQSSVAILLNLAAYLGCCAAALSLTNGKATRPAVAAIAALSLAPSAVMWSLQPLKDMTFLFLVAAFFAVAHLWQRTWSERASLAQLGRATVWTLLLGALLYGISGIRWYFAVILILAAVPFVILAVARAQARLAAAATALLLLPLLGMAFFSGGGPYVPLPLREAVFGSETVHRTAIPSVLFSAMAESRKGFDRTAGATTIGAGGAVRVIDHSLGAPEEHVEVPREVHVAAATPAPKKAEERKKSNPSRSEKTAETTPAPAATATVAATPMASSAAPPATSSATPPATTPASKPQTQPQPQPQLQPRANAPAPSAPATAAPAAAAVTAKSAPPPATPPPAAKPAAPAPEKPRVAAAEVPKAAVAAKESAKPRPKHVAAEPPPQKTAAQPVKPAPVVTPAPAPVRAVAAPAPAPAAHPAESEGATSDTVALPTSPVSRLVAGLAAVILPRAVAQFLGLVNVGGGRGLWLVVELDTIVFDVVLFFTALSIVRGIRRRSLGAPVFWMMFFVTAAICAALAYTVSNFGTLFRHRDMILLGLALLPLAALPPAEDEERVAHA